MANVDNSDVRAALQAVLPALVDGLPAVLDQVTRVLEESWPEYAEFLTAQRAEVVRTGRLAVHQIVATAQRSLVDGGFASPSDTDSGLVLFEEIGRVQWRTGNSLETLMSSYQTGARIAWRELALISVRNEVPASGVALLADALFAFVDHLSAASARGYVEEQSTSVSERERARTDLVELLLSDRSDSRLIEATAQRARWPLPTTVAIVLIPDEPVALDLLARLGPSCLPVRHADAVGALVPDSAAPGLRSRLEATLRGAQAVIGPSVPMDNLPAALRITQVAARLLRDGAVRADPLFVDEHLDAVIVHRDARLLEALQKQVLAPLSALPPETRSRLCETLTSWLNHLGDRQAVAAELHVHRQTVRYRLAQLKELFGAALDDPRFRMKLVLALAWQPQVRDDPNTDVPQQTRRRQESRSGSANQRRS
jgi:hypothetical protein